MWLKLIHLCICQDGVNIIVRHDDTSEYSCSVDRKVVRLRRVGNGARSRATRETGNWWRTRWHLLRTSTTTDGALRISVSFLSLDGCEKQTLAWQVGEIAQFLRWAIWHFRVITRCASYFTTEPLFHGSKVVSNNLRRIDKILYKIKEINAGLRVGPELGISGPVTNLKHGISYMCPTWHCTHARMHATPFRCDKCI